MTKVLQRFNMLEAKPVGSTLPVNCRLSGKQSLKMKAEKAEMMKVPYASVVGSLMYAMVCTRPDIGYVVGVVSRLMSNPGKEHWNMVKWILRYLKGTWNMCLRFGSSEPQHDGFTYSDMSADVDTSRSTSRYVMTYAGGAISWQSRLQKTEDGCVVNHGGRAHGGCGSRQGNIMDEGLHR